MSRKLIRILFCAILAAGAPAGAIAAAHFHALARLLAKQSSIRDAGTGVALRLALSQGVPFRVFTLAAPPRLVLDFREVDWGAGLLATLDCSVRVKAVRVGRFRPGWTRMVLDLDAPLAVKTAAMSTAAASGTALVRVRLVPVSAKVFAARSGALDGRNWALPKAAKVAPAHRRQTGGRPLLVVLDPGHGGIDPGAEAGGLREKDIVLKFAREFKEMLVRTGRYRVILTRNQDVFVPLPTRVDVARAAGADLFISIHADSLAKGRATGAAVYTLSRKASDLATKLLAEQQDRVDMLAGVDLTGQDDTIAEVLMDMARTETQPRSEHLADALVAGFENSVGRLYKHPRRAAEFSVLKAADIPSVLIELGFLSDAHDRRDLTDPAWRARLAQGLVKALDRWAKGDAAQARLLRH